MPTISVEKEEFYKRLGKSYSESTTFGIMRLTVLKFGPDSLRRV